MRRNKKREGCEQRTWRGCGQNVLLKAGRHTCEDEGRKVGDAGAEESECLLAQFRVRRTGVAKQREHDVHGRAHTHLCFFSWQRGQSVLLEQQTRAASNLKERGGVGDWHNLAWFVQLLTSRLLAVCLVQAKQLAAANEHVVRSKEQEHFTYHQGTLVREFGERSLSHRSQSLAKQHQCGQRIRHWVEEQFFSPTVISRLRRCNLLFSSLTSLDSPHDKYSFCDSFLTSA